MCICNVYVCMYNVHCRVVYRNSRATCAESQYMRLLYVNMQLLYVNMQLLYVTNFHRSM